MNKESIFVGVVSWFNVTKGYGFIIRNDKQKDIFVHYSDISQPGFKLLMAGDKVSFEEDFNFKNRLKAINVLLLERNNG